MDGVVKKYLSENEIRAEHLILNTLCRSSEDAAKAAGTDIKNVVKTILLNCDGETIACILCGDDRIALKKVKKIIGGKTLKLLNEKEISERTGYRVGGIPPFGYRALFIVDHEVIEREQVYCGGGSDRSLVRIEPQELLRTNKGMVAEIRSLVIGSPI